MNIYWFSKGPCMEGSYIVVRASSEEDAQNIIKKSYIPENEDRAHVELFGKVEYSLVGTTELLEGDLPCVVAKVHPLATPCVTVFSRDELFDMEEVEDSE